MPPGGPTQVVLLDPVSYPGALKVCGGWACQLAGCHRTAHAERASANTALANACAPPIQVLQTSFWPPCLVHRQLCAVSTANCVLCPPPTVCCVPQVFAREVCKNDLLNFGRLHFFFPDSRLSLDLNTDKTLKARAGGRCAQGRGKRSAARGTGQVQQRRSRDGLCQQGMPHQLRHVASCCTLLGSPVCRRPALTVTLCATCSGAGTSWRSWRSGASWRHRCYWRVCCSPPPALLLPPGCCCCWCRRRPCLPTAALPASTHPPHVQMAARRRVAEAGGSPPRGDTGEERGLYSFTDLFQAIKVEDFSSYISKVGGRWALADGGAGVGALV